MKSILAPFILALFTPVFCRAQAGSKPLEITHLQGDFYVYKTYGSYKGQKIPANASYLVTQKGVVLFDTPWDPKQFQPLLDSIQKKHHHKVALCISTHFHEDRTGGLEFYRKKGIATYTTKQTDSLSKLHGMKRAAYLMAADTTFRFGQYVFQTYYPGKGHAPDNIVIWFPKEKILYGGCLIKSVDDKDLGNLSDASIPDYAGSVRNVISHCPDPRYIITGHNNWRDTASLRHTLEMAEKAWQKRH